MLLHNRVFHLHVKSPPLSVIFGIVMRGKVGES